MGASTAERWLVLLPETAQLLAVRHTQAEAEHVAELYRGWLPGSAVTVESGSEPEPATEIGPPVGALVTYDYGAAAISCQFNGARIRGIGHVTGYEPDGWVVVNDRLRVRESEIVAVGTHALEVDESGFGCKICRFGTQAEVHGETARW